MKSSIRILKPKFLPANEEIKKSKVIRKATKETKRTQWEDARETRF